MICRLSAIAQQEHLETRKVLVLNYALDYVRKDFTVPLEQKLQRW